jgi:GR25 family glycosyltransferase involved in LPS biosynthesis
MNQHFYINLENRPERNGETITELKKLGIKKPNRFNAITHEIPLVGCARSHIGCLKKAKELGWDYVIIFEDDLKIESKKKLIEKFKKYINQEFWDVLYLGCWNYLPPVKVEEDLAKVVKSWCLHAYIVKSHYYDTLINHLEESVKLKIKEPENMNYNNDVYIHTLQAKDKWYCLLPIHITQRNGWSDNFNEVTNFSEKIKNIPQ